MKFLQYFGLNFMLVIFNLVIFTLHRFLYFIAFDYCETWLAD